MSFPDFTGLGMPEPAIAREMKDLAVGYHDHKTLKLNALGRKSLREPILARSLQYTGRRKGKDPPAKGSKGRVSPPIFARPQRKKFESSSNQTQPSNTQTPPFPQAASLKRLFFELSAPQVSCAQLRELEFSIKNGDNNPQALSRKIEMEAGMIMFRKFSLPNPRCRPRMAALVLSAAMAMALLWACSSQGGDAASVIAESGPDQIRATAGDLGADKGLVLIDFYADWCPPCKIQGPVVENVGKRIDFADVLKVDVDANPEAARVFRISAIPTLAVLKDGKLLDYRVGLHSDEDELIEILRSYSDSDDPSSS